MAQKEAIPHKTVYRLSIYHRCLQRLRENEVDTVSSEALARAAGVKSTQLRKDLAYLGNFGTRGIGYNVASLAGMIGETLGTTRLQPVILVGVGNLGSALLRYGGFNKEGFEIVGAFDAEPAKVKQLSTKIPILPDTALTEFIQRNGVKLAILCVPSIVAQQVVNTLVASGIQAILNFAPVFLDVPSEVKVNSVDVAVELENLSYFIR